MSKQADAKLLQHWRKQPDTCGNCAHFRSEIVEKRYRSFSGPTSWTEEKNLRCGIGGFKVGKTNTCDAHSLQSEPPKESQNA